MKDKKNRTVLIIVLIIAVIILTYALFNLNALKDGFQIGW